jgi:hypothetical protein
MTAHSAGAFRGHDTQLRSGQPLPHIQAVKGRILVWTEILGLRKEASKKGPTHRVGPSQGDVTSLLHSKYELPS